MIAWRARRVLGERGDVDDVDGGVDKIIQRSICGFDCSSYLTKHVKLQSKLDIGIVMLQYVYICKGYFKAKQNSNV